MIAAFAVVVIASQKEKSQGPGASLCGGDDSALESHSLSLVFPVGNLKLGLRELNSS